MSTELICPDCGGIIGGDATDPGRVCTCFANSDSSPKVQTAQAKTNELLTADLQTNDVQIGEESSSDTVVDQVEAPKAKVCCQCGKDLSGHRRLRDSRGYWCYACHKLDKEATKPKGVACADCGRIVAEAALADYEGRMLCGPCRQEQKDTAKERRRLSPVQTTAHDEMAKKRLLWILGVAAVLIVIILLRTFKIIGS